MNLFYLGAIDLCSSKFGPVWTIFGYIIFGIQIVVPLLLIIFGMLTMAKAIMEDDEKKIKSAQDLLVKRLIAAALTFLIVFIVKLLVGLVGPAHWDGCVKCALNPFDKGVDNYVTECNNNGECNVVQSGTYNCGFNNETIIDITK